MTPHAHRPRGPNGASAGSARAAHAPVEIAISVLVALGPVHDSVPPAVTSALGAIGARTDAELVVAEDRATPELRHLLAQLPGPVRTRHNPGARFGTAGTLAAAARCALAPILVLVGAETSLAPDALGRIEAAFAADPALGLVLGEDRDGPGGDLVALRAAVLEGAGGARVLEDAGESSECLLGDGAADAMRAAGVRTACIDLAAADSRATLRWEAEAPIGAAAARPLWEPLAHERHLRPGVNVIGILEAACGTGDAARRYVEALTATEARLATYGFHGHISPPFPFEHLGPRTAPYDVNLFALNPEQLLGLAALAGEELWPDRYSIGVWFWELDALTETHTSAARLVHELWAASRFLADAFSAGTDRQVITVPLPVRRRDAPPTIGRGELGLPDRFVFLTMLDFGSLAPRKNGLGAIGAFTSAFAPGEGPVLVVKTLNARHDPAGAAALEAAIAGRRDIVLVDAYLSDDAVSALVGHADCLVSLHRCEGFGLSLADAMAFGHPVIATAYSGNLEFMHEQNSYLVDYELASVPDTLGAVYPAGARWAEPRLDHAAALMRHVYEHPEDAAARGARAQRDIRVSNSTGAAAAVIEARLAHIAELRSRAGRQRQGTERRPRPSSARARR